MSRSPPLPRVLWALLFGNFVIGTGVLVVPATLNELSDSLQVSIATAGQLITASAVVMAVGAALLPMRMLVGIAPALASGSIALNSSAMYAGQAIGATSGGALVARDQMGMLHWAGLALLLLLLLGMAASAWAASHRASHLD